MTINVAFLCSDGVVIAADSMITMSMGNTAFANRVGNKIHLLPDEIITA